MSAPTISCECEFLMFLALKEAYALEQDNQEMLAETRKAEKLFLRDHLGRFLPTFVTQLAGEIHPVFTALSANFACASSPPNARFRTLGLGKPGAAAHRRQPDSNGLRQRDGMRGDARRLHAGRRQ